MSAKFDHYFDFITMSLVERCKGAWSMGNEKKLDMIHFTQDPREVCPREACVDPERVESAIMEMLKHGAEEPMASLEWKDIQVQVSLWNNNKSFEWVYYEKPL